MLNFKSPKTKVVYVYEFIFDILQGEQFMAFYINILLNYFLHITYSSYTYMETYIKIITSLSKSLYILFY